MTTRENPMPLNVKLIGRAALPLAAIGLIAFAFTVAARPQSDEAFAQPAGQPATAGGSSGAVVAALGVVEPSSETIAVAAQLSGVVRAVIVKPGDDVARGAPLFRLDSRAVEARLGAARAALRVAQIDARDAQARAGLFSNISDARAVSADEKDRARYAADRAAATVGLRAAEVQELETELAQLTVRAPIDGRVLRVNVRPGEFAPAGPSESPLIALGDVSPLHVRVQIDEEDAARVAAGAKAEGALRGDNARRVGLQFVRFEPQATPKRNLNGGAERIDTRVIEAIYAFEPSALNAFVGQQMDVFVEAAPIAAAMSQGATP
jgi:multidrug efflux pump subunit AcrA (membrane-fusion protein)